MDEVSAKLPAQHGVERAAARLHRMAAAREPKQQWRNLDEGIRRLFRGAVTHMLRDIGPEPRVIADFPLIWYSPRLGILYTEREDWLKGARHVVALRQEIVIELPEDAYRMAPIQPS